MIRIWLKALLCLEHEAGAEKERGRTCKWRGNSGQGRLSQDYTLYFVSPRDLAKIFRGGSSSIANLNVLKRGGGGLSAIQAGWRGKQWRHRSQHCG